jgi:hypothetical protein
LPISSKTKRSHFARRSPDIFPAFAKRKREENVAIESLWAAQNQSEAGCAVSRTRVCVEMLLSRLVPELLTA